MKINSERFILKSLQCSTNWTYKDSSVTVNIRRHIPVLKGDTLYTQEKNAANSTVFKVTADTSDRTYLQENML